MSGVPFGACSGFRAGRIMKQSERLMSLDALRGFDMLFIMGFASFVVAVCGLWPSAVTDAAAASMSHVAWDGFAHHDTIFPLFLFIAGVSFPYSVAKQRAGGMSEGRIYAKIVRRGLTLVVLGMVYNGLFKLDFENLRIASVLGRIGLAWSIAAVLYLNFGVKTRAAIAVAVLAGYGALSALVAAPDAAGAGPLTFEGNLAGYIDRQFLPGKLIYGSFDPQDALDGRGGRGAAGGGAGLQRGAAREQETVVEHLRMRRGSLLAGDVRPVLLPDRRAGLAPLDALFPCRRTQFDYDLSGPAYRGLRTYIRLLPRRHRIEMP